MSPRSLYDRAFPRFSPPREHTPTPVATPAARVTWLGTAAHVIATERTTLLVDPYLSRFSLADIVTRRLRPDDEAIVRWLPNRVDAVLCGHSHFDHLVDAPRIAQLTGARIVGSRSTCSFARAQGLAESRILCIPPAGDRLRIGDIDVRFVPSLHGRIALGRVPFDGEVLEPPHLPARAWQYRMGGAFGILLDAGGVRIYHNGSADLIDAEVAGERADVLLVGLAGRRATRDYLNRLVGALSPSLIIPTHHDAFFAPLEDGLRLLPGVDLEGFLAEAERIAPYARVVLPDYGQQIAVAGSHLRPAARA